MPSSSHSKHSWEKKLLLDPDAVHAADGMWPEALPQLNDA
jgi:hypothetical protein